MLKEVPPLINVVRKLMLIVKFSVLHVRNAAVLRMSLLEARATISVNFLL